MMVPDRKKKRTAQFIRVRYAVNAVLVVLIAAFLAVQLTYLCRGYNRMARFYGLREESLDAVVIGTSTTFTSYMPMEVYGQYGISSAVVATNMQFEGTLPYTIREVEKTQSPKLILIDLMPFIRHHYAGRSDWDAGDVNLFIRYNIDSMKISPDRAKLIHEICRDFGMGWKDEIYYNCDVSRYHLNPANFAQMKNEMHDANRGFQHLQKEGGEAFRAEEMADTDAVIPLEGIEQENFDRLLQTVASLPDCTTVFFCPPVYFETALEAGTKNYVKKAVRERGYEFWDLTEERGKAGLDPETDYRDALHFDSLGSLKVTKMLSDRITAEFSLPDRRQDPAWQDWNTDFEEWEDLRGGYLNVDHAAVRAMERRTEK